MLTSEKNTNKIHRMILIVSMVALSMMLVMAMGCSCKKKSVKTPKPAETTQPTAVTPTPAPTTSPAEPVSPAPAVTENTQPSEQRTAETITPEGCKLDSVYFNFDKYDLSDAARATLVKNAQCLKTNAITKIRVEGNCDERGTVEYNIALGQKRANVVKEYYTSLGISADNIQTISFGEERPLDPGKTEEAFAKNRRSDTKEIK